MKKKNCKEYRRHDLKENVLKQRKSYIPKKQKHGRCKLVAIWTGWRDRHDREPLTMTSQDLVDEKALG